MAPARGDRRPCTHTDCPGTMQFGREPLLQVSATMRVDGERGWVCGDNPGHFQLASRGSQADTTTNASARDRWADDGGQQLADLRPPSIGQHAGRLP